MLISPVVRTTTRFCSAGVSSARENQVASAQPLSSALAASLPLSARPLTCSTSSVVTRMIDSSRDAAAVAASPPRDTSSISGATLKPPPMAPRYSVASAAVRWGELVSPRATPARKVALTLEAG